MSSADQELNDLLDRAAKHDEVAINTLLRKHRTRLLRMVNVRMHEGLARRVDPSDVIQDAMLEASEKLPDYLDARPMPLYLWLRRLVWQKLVQLQRHHLDAQQRTVRREMACGLPLPEASSMQLADQLLAGDTSPSAGAIRQELRGKVREVLGQLSGHDREVLVLLYLEQLSMREAGEVLGISQRATNMRHLRALKRVRRLFSM